jgi:ribonuclease HI
MKKAPCTRREGEIDPKILIYVASSWIQSYNKVAGYAAVIRDRTTGKIRRLSGLLHGGPKVSNIRAEMVAVAEALETLPDDSAVMVCIPSKFYAYKNRKANLDLWKMIDRQSARHVIKQYDDELPANSDSDMIKARKLAREALYKAIMVDEGAGI